MHAHRYGECYQNIDLVCLKKKGVEQVEGQQAFTYI